MKILQFQFATRLSGMPSLFLDELFRVSADPSIISFAGGLPSTALIDTGGIARATASVLAEDAGAVSCNIPTLTVTTHSGNT